MKTNIHETYQNNKIKNEFTIDLSEHVKAYNQNNSIALKESFKQLKKEVDECHFTFENMIDEATKNQSPDRIKIIKLSPAYYYIKQSFAELLKNAIDSKLSQLTKPTDAKDKESGESLILKIEIEIELNSDCKEIKFKVSDNGTGFTEEQLSAIGNKEARKASNYYNHVGSDKYEKKNDKKFFMGGAGRGIRELMGMADEGDPGYGLDKSKIEISNDCSPQINDRIEKKTFVLPEISELLIYNKPGGVGAVIEVNTSTKQLELNQIEETKPFLFEEYKQNLREFCSSPNTISSKDVIGTPPKRENKGNKSPDSITENSEEHEVVINFPKKQPK